ncbi:MAG: outer membrane protein assembly factor BamA [Acidobacteria bacterium]|nr:MAG: outer membrane protein assembly factor BamA [Acidobacteriota bacterium]
MLTRDLWKALAGLLILLCVESVGAQSETIERVVVDGNVRISTSALMSQLTIKEGNPYDEEALRKEYQRLWDLNLFDNITLEVRQGEKGKIVLWHVQDRPLISDVEYKNIKAFTATQIDEKLQEQKADIRRGSPVDYTRIRKTQETLKQMLGQKGFLDAEVKVEMKEVAPGQKTVSFVAHQGGKTKIKKIDFVGNTVLSDRQLKKMMKLTKERGLLTWATSKDLYHPGKFDEDARLIRQAYLDRGYLDVEVKPEVVELLSNQKPPKSPEEERKRKAREEQERQKREKKVAEAAARKAEREAKEQAKAERKGTARTAASSAAKETKEKEPKVPKKWIFVTVPIQEGSQYKIGALTVEGNKVFTQEEILSRVPVKPGEVFNDGAVKQGLGRIQLDYGEKGYFYVTANQVVDRQPDQVADLKIEINEERQYRINTLEFAGNTTTRDRVLRREIPVGEEDLFDLKRFRLGLRKINQLGYWQITEEANIHPRTGEDKVDIVIPGKEANRNEIQVGGGVSGLNGAFLSGSYATRNFLGRGEILQAYFQLGGRQSRYSLSFIEPWFLGRPWTLGASLFRRTSDFRNAVQEGHGGSLQVGRLLGTFSRLDFTYIYEFASASQGGISTAETLTSSIIPAFTYDSRNNFFRPTRGYRLSVSTQLAGGPLGGDNYFVRPLAFATAYFPAFRKQYIALNAAGGYVRPFGGRQVPIYDRFYLGGERSLRAFKSRTISPERKDIDLNHNGIIDRPEDLDRDGILDSNEDANNNGVLDTEDLNHNGVLDPGEDLNGNGILDTEDLDGDGRLDPNEDRNGNGSLDTGEDTNGDGVYGSVFPGGDKFVQFNFEYVFPMGDTAEIAGFVDTGNAFDNGQQIDLRGLRMDYGMELRFYLPIFQAPLRFIYGFIQDPQPGEKASSFQFSIGTTF